ncbi:MAG: hypothetical protein FJ033_06150 [Chloroflexi bacterium]|nr:hypothetical protein [Chloroflexota bacterium]
MVPPVSVARHGSPANWPDTMRGDGELGKRVLGTTYDQAFLPQSNEINVVLDETMPPLELITSAGPSPLTVGVSSWRV